MNAAEPDEAEREPTVRAFAERWGFNAGSPRLRAALTHTSAASSGGESSERLEFLGDALLSAFVARFLFDALPPTTGEDVLSRARVHVVRKETLAEAGRAMGLPDLIAVGPGERKERRHHHDSLVADAYEALVAAAYLDQGPERMADFLHRTLGETLAAVVAAPPSPDPKTLLQMRLQATGRGLPRYETVGATGDGHDHHFVIAVRDADGVVLGRGEGRNKRTAEQAAAEDALHHL